MTVVEERHPGFRARWGRTPRTDLEQLKPAVFRKTSPGPTAEQASAEKQARAARLAQFNGTSPDDRRATENAREASRKAAREAAARRAAERKPGQCMYGHDMTDPANVALRRNGEGRTGRSCRQCKRERDRGRNRSGRNRT